MSGSNENIKYYIGSTILILVLAIDQNVTKSSKEVARMVHTLILSLNLPHLFAKMYMIPIMLRNNMGPM